MTNLRTRLQQRRERIAAGLPPPPAVTVTDSFFTSNMTRTSSKQCTECTKRFEPHGKQIVCSQVCYDARTSRLRKKGDIQHTCEECQGVFWSNRSDAVVCSEPCRIERRRRYQREWAKENYGKIPEPMADRICAVEGCGLTFTPKNPLQETCGYERCKKKHRLVKSRVYDKAWRERQKLAQMMRDADEKGRAA